MLLLMLLLIPTLVPILTQLIVSQFIYIGNNKYKPNNKIMTTLNTDLEDKSYSIMNAKVGPNKMSRNINATSQLLQSKTQITQGSKIKPQTTNQNQQTITTDKVQINRISSGKPTMMPTQTHIHTQNHHVSSVQVPRIVSKNNEVRIWRLKLEHGPIQLILQNS